MTPADGMPHGFLRVRTNQLETHYLGGLMSGASVARIMTDCASEVGIRLDGTDGYLAGYEKFDFLKPVSVGDILEVAAELVDVGNRSRRVAVEARRAVHAVERPGGLSGGEVYDEPELVARGTIISVIPRELMATRPPAPLLANMGDRRPWDPAKPRGYLRLRVNQLETHYLGGLLAGASLARMMTDCGSELGVRVEGVDGYLAAYEKTDFLAPVYAGDFLEITAEIIAKGRRSRRLALEARRVIRAREQAGGLSGGEVLDVPEVVARGITVGVTPREYAGA